MKKAVLFDLDGTLLNTVPDIAASMNATLSEYGLPVFPVSAYCRMVGSGARVLAERVAGAAHPEWVEDIYRAYIARYTRHSMEETYPYDGMIRLLDALRAAGLRLAVVSNKEDADVRSVMAHYFASVPFDALRGHLPQEPLKPDPASTFAVAAELGVLPEECWYVGDTEVDVQTAAAAGMDFIGAGWGFRTEDDLRAAGARFIAQTPLQTLELLLG